MSANLDKLKAIMREMFQLDQAELDFGIYRIMNQKRDDIEKFLDKDLMPQVQEAFSAYQGTDQKAVKEELEKLRKTLEDAGVVAEDAPKFKSLQDKLLQSVDVTALENEVFSHLANFFRRYYQEGDFLSLRRYKAGVYAIPYEGEEIKLHSANADQYYIKSTENFRDYTFKLPSGKRVHFKLVEASTEQNNKKEQKDKERRFTLCGDNPVVEEKDELFINFAFRVLDGSYNAAESDDIGEEGSETKKKKKTIPQDKVNKSSIAVILRAAPDDWKRGLTTVVPTEKNPNRTVLEKHLTDYTARYTFDYFIHKDLGGFLCRELDFFIKNEVLFLDDLDIDTVQKSLSKAKVIKGIGQKIITFLEQLENFQKKLWLKKKFVVETNYCVTLDRVPEELYPVILDNKAQREEWKRLFAIQDIIGDMHTLAYTEPLTVDFLKANRFLVLDTAFFDKEFTDRLLASDSILATSKNLEEATDGLLVNSENFQALNLIQERLKGQVKCAYIDPPYNTDASPILYKNGYKCSSWISLMNTRLALTSSLLKDDGTIAVAIDDEQQRELSFLLSDVFKDRLLGTFCVRSNPSGRPTQTGYSVAHEYVLFAGNSPQAVISRMPPTAEQMARFSEKDEDGVFEWRNLRREGSDSNRSDRRSLYYPIYITENSIRVPNMTWDESEEEWIIEEKPLENEQVVYPDNEDGVQKRWRWSHEKVMKCLTQLSVRKDRSKRDYVYCKRRPHEEGVVSVSTWFDAKYSATEHGTAVLKDLFKESPFSYPKSIWAVMDSIYIGGASHPSAYILDYFAGSGTTAHAVINHNREDGGRRKYVLVEMGDYFDTALKPRVQKVIYSKDWSEGKPVSRKGSSHLFKYIRLESYEDTLNNLQMKRTEGQQTLLDHHDNLREEYMLSYMLDVESRGSASLLNVDEFKDPFGYQMKIARGNETKVATIDLMETFNYLLGIKVLRISAPERRTAEFEKDGEGRLQLKGKPRSCAIGEGWTFREVEGKTLDEEKVLIIWRTLTGNAEEDNLMLEAYFSKRNYSTLDFEFSRIYVNGDNNLENLKIGEERWKVALIEQEFKRLMFDVEGM